MHHLVYDINRDISKNFVQKDHFNFDEMHLDVVGMHETCQHSHIS